MSSNIITLLPAITGVLANRAALRLGLRKPIDGWRRAVGLVLRGEESTFILSAFGLDPWSDSPASSAANDRAETDRHIAQRLHTFLMQERELHIHILRGLDEDRSVSAPAPSYTLRFEPAPPGPARFMPPTDWSGTRRDDLAGQHPNSLPLFNIVVRTGRDSTCDIWLRANHVGIDGVPVQDALTRLEKSWGVRHPVLFPTPDAFAPFSTPQPIAGRGNTAQIQTFLDFAPLLAWRKQQNAQLPEPMTVAAAILWRLSLHPRFRALHMGTTVEVAPRGTLARGVGVVVVQPSRLHAQPDGLARYVRTFNADMERTRRRETRGCKTLDAAAFLAPNRARALLRHALDTGTTAFGSLGLTMLKDARVFGAPLAETGHINGFIAIGSLALPTESGTPVGCITIKGPTDRIADYPRLLAEALSVPSSS